jgi:3-hydroxyisobutyrate dehydrogenase-like beta-hydroxyacid dehydrogenase
MSKVGFIGLGEQDKPMAINLAKSQGFDLMVYDLCEESVAEGDAERGARWRSLEPGRR